MVSNNDKVAIIGFGASGLGTYLSLKEKGFKKIFIYDHLSLEGKSEIDEWNKINLIKNYKYLKKILGFKTANSKTYFRNQLNAIGSNNSKIYDNQIGGGLLNFWGGVLQKFDKKTLQSSLKINNLDDYYLKISKNIPISQIIHKNSKANIYANQQNINCGNYIEEIDESLLHNSSEIIKKDTIVAISQNIEKEDCHCFIGCLKHDIFKTSKLDLDQNVTIVNEKVLKIDFHKNTIISNSSTQAFDKIFLNAGPYNDQKILIESLEENNKSIRVKDSISFTFPIFFKGNLKKEKNNFALTNYIFSIKDQNSILGHVQIYPPIEHINKSIFPSFLWDRLGFFKNLSVNRVLWARCYLNDDYAQIKEFKKNEDSIGIKKIKIKNLQKKFFEIFKRNFDNSNFIAINYFINSKTSSHYSGDCNYIKQNIIKFDGNHYNKKIFFNDSLLWESLPSDSPTFTIMANAFRVSDLYL